MSIDYRYTYVSTPTSTSTYTYTYACIYIYIHIYIYIERAGCCVAWVFADPLFVSYLHCNNFKHSALHHKVPYTFLSNVFKVRFSLCIVRRQRVRHRGIEWLRIQSSSHNNYGAGNTVNTEYSVLYQTRSWGRPHRLDTSDTEPYILSLQDSSILSSQSTQHQNQRIICFGMQCSVVGEPLRIELAEFFGKVHRNRNKYLWQCFRFVIACQQV